MQVLRLRDERFTDDTEQVKLQALSGRIDEAAGFTPDDHRTVEYTTAPKGVPGRDLDNCQRKLLLSLLGTYFGRVPEGGSPLASYDDFRAR